MRLCRRAESNRRRKGCLFGLIDRAQERRIALERNCHRGTARAAAKTRRNRPEPRVLPAGPTAPARQAAGREPRARAGDRDETAVCVSPPSTPTLGSLTPAGSRDCSLIAHCVSPQADRQQTFPAFSDAGCAAFTPTHRCAADAKIAAIACHIVRLAVGGYDDPRRQFPAAFLLRLLNSLFAREIFSVPAPGNCSQVLATQVGIPAGQGRAIRIPS